MTFSNNQQVIRSFCTTYVVLFMLLLLTLPSVAPAAYAATVTPLEHFTYETPQLHKKDKELYLYMPVSVNNEDSLQGILRDGATIQLKLDTTVKRQRTLWFGEKLQETSFSLILKHDLLTRNFRIIGNEGEIISQHKNLRSLLQKSWKKLDIPIISLDQLHPEEQYSVDISLSLQHVELPPWLDKTLVFWSRDIVAPETLKLDYRLNDAPISR